MTLTLTQIPRSETGMLIRRPPAEVFEAFVDPAITTRFWFTRGSGRLEVGKEITWEWEMYGISIPVTARTIEPHRRLVIEWPGSSEPATVEWKFTGRAGGHTFVEVTESGFAGTGDEIVRQVADSTQGFSLALAGLKAWLEHSVQLELVRDRYPDGIAQ